MTSYTCEVCGKHLEPALLWECVEDNEALHRGETVVLGDHVHRPDVVPGDSISLVPIASTEPHSHDA
jgi:hypothetical protein